MMVVICVIYVGDMMLDDNEHGMLYIQHTHAIAVEATVSDLFDVHSHLLGCDITQTR